MLAFSIVILQPGAPVFHNGVTVGEIACPPALQQKFHMFLAVALLLVVCVSAVLAVLALKLWFWAQRKYRLWRSNGGSLYRSRDGSISPAAVARCLHETSLPFRAKVYEVLRHHEFQDDLDEEPLGVQERVEQTNRRMQVICDARLLAVEQLAESPEDFFEAIEIIAAVRAFP